MWSGHAVLLLMAVLLSMAPGVLAQTTSTTILGVIADSTGAVINGAKVTGSGHENALTCGFPADDLE